ncbi:MAG: hypothetical protein ACREBS_11110 [Nitrososphaerales archaeon]
MVILRLFCGVFESKIEKVKKLLGIPADFHPVGTISIGMASPDVKSPSLKRGRKPWSEVVHSEHW